ncbi:nucleotidyltransferase [Alienimonas chondri]|uniref:Nucleotidyltransferase family protein n=1 Tax=Alienimonas chondri TaxID=2681879 RepID=A0ABX1VBU9_9PLAN|nr:nucleotidyltransferase [Alienimonas chondri]NNJ24906.1 hypothetical protein [Alienimonas chondri]
MTLPNGDSPPLDIYNEFFAVVHALEAASVPYCVVGGLAVSLLARPRATEDIDLLTLPESVEAAAEVIESVGYFESAQPWTFSQSGVTLRRFMKTLGRDYLIIDLMFRDSDDYRAIVSNAGRRQEEAGVVRLIARDDLIAMKRAAGRPQDLADIAALEATADAEPYSSSSRDGTDA